MEVLTDANISSMKFTHSIGRLRTIDFKFEELNKEYFALIGQRLPDQVRYFIMEADGRMIAFNLCLVHGGTFAPISMSGSTTRWPLDLHMYFGDVVMLSWPRGATDPTRPS